MIDKKTKDKIYFEFFHIAVLRGWSTSVIAKKLNVCRKTALNIKHQKHDTKISTFEKMALHIMDQKARGFY